MSYNHTWINTPQTPKKNYHHKCNYIFGLSACKFKSEYQYQGITIPNKTVSTIHLKDCIGIINIKGSKPDSAFNELKLMSSNVTITNGKALFRMKLKWNEIEHQELHVMFKIKPNRL